VSATLRDALGLDLEAKADELARALRAAVVQKLRRRGIVVAVSGGVDSACVAALSVKALGADRVHALLLPERDSSPESLALGRALCERFGIRYEIRDISAMLEAAGCYEARDAAVRAVFPEFERDLRWKIVTGGDPLAGDALHFFQLVVRDRAGQERRFRLPPKAYLEIVAATNFKQRIRKMMEYYDADRLGFAVAGTPNRLEYDQGFFVKLGDGAADVKPIASLYKTQVFALARHLGVNDEILDREPTTDTFSLAQSQEDFFYSIDYRTLDVVLWAKNHGVGHDIIAAEMGLTLEQVARVCEDIDQKRRTTAYLHAPPLLLDRIVELHEAAAG
jgi:NAD+ synthase